MDTPSLITITSEIPEDEVIVSKLPPLLGPLRKENGEISYKYHNILELENCSFHNHIIAKEKGRIDISHYYTINNNGPDYSHQYLDVDSPSQVLAPGLNKQPERGNKWINMNGYQLSTLINQKWFELFGVDLLTFDSQNKKYTLSIPPGIGVYLCHPVIWGVLGIWDLQLMKVYTVPEYEKAKFSGSLGNSISGYCNDSSKQYFTLTGKRTAAVHTPANKFPIITEGIILDSNPIKSTWLFGVITFATKDFQYEEFHSKELELSLVPCSIDFMNSLKELILDYSGMIQEYEYMQDSDESINLALDELDVVPDSKNQMIIKTKSKSTNGHNIVIHLSLNKVLQNYLGQEDIKIERSITVINPYNQNELIQKNIYKYPYFLVLASTDFIHDLDTSVVNNKKLPIIAVIHSESKFTTTQSLIKLRPSRFNKLVLKVLNNQLETITERVSCELIFRFKREFIEENTSLHFYNYGLPTD